VADLLTIERTLAREIAPAVERGLPGVEVLAVEVLSPRRFCVYVDHPEGVDHALCARVTQLLYQHRRQSIDGLIGDYLIEQAAKKAGTSKDKYLEDELAKRRGAITDADIQKVFDENRDRVGASTVADLKDSITTFITRNRDAQNAAILVGELKKAGAAVKIALDPPRVDVTIAAHDPARGPADAPVTIVEFSEYQCPFCARVTPTLAALRLYQDLIRFHLRDDDRAARPRGPRFA